MTHIRGVWCNDGRCQICDLLERVARLEKQRVEADMVANRRIALLEAKVRDIEEKIILRT